MSQESTVHEKMFQCALCLQEWQESAIAMQGRLKFCQLCARGRSRECLQLLDGRQRRGFRWPVIALVFLAAAGGLAFWKRDALPAISWVVKVKPATPPEKSAAPAPVAAEPGGEAASPSTMSWLQRSFGGSADRAVEDVGHLQLLFVTLAGTSGSTGFASHLYITREARSSEPAKLTTETGSQMKTAFDEALRYVRKQPRGWERMFSIRLSFQDKFSDKDGPSAGTAFAVAMLGAIQDFKIDPQVSLTGDLSIDGTVEPVGSIVEKMRGAIAGKCLLTMVPESNAEDVADLVLLDGISPLWDTQIFSIGKVDDAVALARVDRPANLAAALARFQQLRARLPARVTPNYLHSPEVISELKEVLALAPNHLSAVLLQRATNQQHPLHLTFRRSVDEIVSISQLFVGPVISPEETKTVATGTRPGSAAFPDAEYGECMKRLGQITPLLHPRTIELKAACTRYTSALRTAATYKEQQWQTIQQPAAERVSMPRIQTRDQLKAWQKSEEERLERDREAQERYHAYLRAQQSQRASESTYRQGTEEELREARTQLLVAFRKYSADREYVAESLK